MFVITNDFKPINRIVQTKYGYVRGAWGNDQTITVFRGIPYAAAPVGSLRWKAPQPPKAWEGVRDALKLVRGHGSRTEMIRRIFIKRNFTAIGL